MLVGLRVASSPRQTRLAVPIHEAMGGHSPQHKAGRLPVSVSIHPSPFVIGPYKTFNEALKEVEKFSIRKAKPAYILVSIRNVEHVTSFHYTPNDK